MFFVTIKSHPAQLLNLFLGMSGVGLSFVTHLLLPLSTPPFFHLSRSSQSILCTLSCRFTAGHVRSPLLWRR